jgi:cyanophycinase
MAIKSEVRGTLIPIGGNEDKGQHEFSGVDFIDQGILAQVVAQSGGIKANIVVIPTASSIPIEVGENYLSAFQLLDCNNVTVLNILKKSEANAPETLKLIAEANCVMFSGGDQSRISRIIGGTKMHELLSERYKNDDFVIAGTSAGAMAMATEMVAGGSSTESLLVGAVRMKKGLGLLPNFIIDTHFVKRGRFGRLTEAVAIYPNLMGVGLAEDTGLIIKNGTHFRVIGSGMVILFDPSKLTHNKHAVLPKGTPMSISNLITHVLARGDQFMFEDRKIEVFTSVKIPVA